MSRFISGSTLTLMPALKRQRGASQAACGSWPWSSMRTSVCRWPCGCMLPPITPKLICGWPSLVRNAGMMVWNGRLPGPTTLGLSRVEREAVAAVLQADAVLGHDHAGAEAHVVALDEADHHAALVGRGEVDRAALGRRAGAEGLRALRVDQARALLQVGVVEHLRRRDRHRARLGHVAVGVGEAELHRLDLQVLRGRRRRHRSPPMSKCSRMPSAISAAMPCPFGGISCSR